VQQEHQTGALAKLIGDRTPCDELLALDHERGGEIVAMRWERSRHEGHPLQKVLFVAIYSSYSLSQSLRQLTLELFMERSTKAMTNSCGWSGALAPISVCQYVSTRPSIADSVAPAPTRGSLSTETTLNSNCGMT
jgi:hypothetical protein